MSNDLERLYQEAKSALRARDYDRAADFLRQVLLIDENYKDTSRLLAQVVKLRRRTWYNHPRLWGMVGLLVIVGLGFLIASRVQGLYARQPVTTLAPDNTPAAIFTSTIVATATETSLPAPTTVPLAWKRVTIGQEFERDVVTGFVTDPKDLDVIYASLKNAGIYKTIDGGLSWRPAHQGLQNTHVGSLVIDPQNPGILYAGTLAGIYKTTDGGENWARVGDGNSVLMDPQNSSHLYAHDNNVIYESMDQGNTWTIKYSLNGNCPNNIRSWAIHREDGQTIFLGASEGSCSGVYQSKDGGKSWSEGGEFPHDIDMLSTGQDSQGNQALYIGHRGAIVGVMHEDGSNFVQFLGCNVPVIAQADSPEAYCAGPQGGLRVIDNTVAKVSRIGLDTSLITAIHVDRYSETERILAGGARLHKHLEDGIFITVDGGKSWEQRNAGLGIAKSELKISPIKNTEMYVSVYSDAPWAWNGCTLYQSLDGGTNWKMIKRNSSGWCGPAFDGANMLYMDDGGALQKSWDSGKTWLWEGEAGANYSFPSWPLWPGTLSANPYIARLVYVTSGSGKVYYSADEGLDWQSSNIDVDLTDARLFFKDQGQTVFAIGPSHQAYSTDSGKTWQGCTEEITTSPSDLRLALDLQDSYLYAATPGNGVLISTDNCASWQASNEGLNNLFINAVAVDPNNPGTVYAGTDGGAYISFNEGQTWNEINDGLYGATVVYSIAVDQDSNVYAATPYGIFKLESK